MNLDQMVENLQNAREKLDALGLTNGLLIGVGVVSLILLFWSVRELVAWFLKVQALRQEVRSLHAKLDHLTALVQKQQAPLIVEVASEEEEAKASAKPAGSAFRLDH